MNPFRPLTEQEKKDLATRRLLFAYDCRNAGFPMPTEP